MPVDGGSDAGGVSSVRVYRLPKGLPLEEAFRRATWCDGGRDYVGFTYNPRTGYATLSG